MKKNRNQLQKILLFIIGVLSVILMAVLIHKAYQLHQEKIQKEEWEVRHKDVQSELEDVQVQIKELAGDGDALQEFLDEKLNPAIIVPEPEAVVVDVPEQDMQGGEETELSTSEDEMPEIINGGENAIIIQEPEPPKPQIEQNSISANDQETEEPEEIVSENAIPEEPEEIVSENAIPEEPEEIVSENAVPEEPEEIVSENAVPEEPEEIVSENAIPEVEVISGNGIVDEGTQEIISGNAIVDGKVIPFRYEEIQPTLQERRSIRSSYEETILVNDEDKNIISNNADNFSDIKIACLGDSLTEGSNMNNLENYQQYSYPAVLKNLLQAEEVYNLGIGGSSYGRYWDQAFVDRYKEIPEDSDIIIVMGGTNDGFAASVKELGSLEEKKPRTFYGDVDELMRGLIRDYPNAKIIFTTPLPNVLHDYLRKQRDYLLPQSVFADAIKELAAQHDIEVIDLYNSNILDTHDAQIISSYMPDGVHGNQKGYQVLAEHLASEIIQIAERGALYKEAVSANLVQSDGAETVKNVSGNDVIDVQENVTDQPETQNASQEAVKPGTAPVSEPEEESGHEYSGEAIIIQ